MNDYDIARAQRAFADHPVLGPAIETLGNLVVWTNCHSDGWAYWPKPCRAAKRLMEMIERDGTWEFSQGERLDATEAEYKAALRPIKAFRTRYGGDFDIVEVDGSIT
jgi:hypothetical protein